MPTGQPKRLHHHVWQYYLSAWGAGETVACRREGRVFKTGTAVLGVARDLYRIEEPSAAEVEFLAKVCFPPKMNPMLRSLNRGWLPIFLAPSALERIVKESGAVEDPEVQQLLEVARSNIEEDLHMKIEADSIKYLDALRSRDLSFLEDGGDRAAFLHYLATQAFRTRGMRKRIAEAVRGLVDVRAENVVGPMTHVFATNVGWAIYSKWAESRVSLLENDGGVEFITSDQPVVNSWAVDQPPGEEVEKLTYYYPVSPGLALLWDPEAGERRSLLEPVSRSQVEEANRWMVHSADEQLYARDEGTLLAL